MLLRAFFPVVGVENTIHSERSLYRDIAVTQRGNIRCMQFNRQVKARQTCISLIQPHQLVHDYTRMMMGALYLNPAPQHVLVIGLGGGAIPKALLNILPNAQIDVVELDPAVVNVAQQYFDFKLTPNVKVITKDARVYVKQAGQAQQQYDLIFLDAFDHEYIPEHLLTQEFLNEVIAILAPDGVLTANTFSFSKLYENESVTYAKVFGQFFNLKSENRVIIARPDGLPDAAILKANAELLVPKFELLGINQEWLLDLFNTRQDWPRDARILTDQYSPANLLNTEP